MAALPVCRRWLALPYVYVSRCRWHTCRLPSALAQHDRTAMRFTSTNRRNGTSRLRISRCTKKAAEATGAKMACTAVFAAISRFTGPCSHLHPYRPDGCRWGKACASSGWLRGGCEAFTASTVLRKATLSATPSACARGSYPAAPGLPCCCRSAMAAALCRFRLPAHGY